MARRILVEFTCDCCKAIERVVAIPKVQQGTMRKLQAYPVGWGTTEENQSVDICPKCVRKANDMCTQGRSQKGIAQ